MNINIGDILTLKKKHPCGGFHWEVLRVGADIKIRCSVCNNLIMLPREKLEKSIKKINDLRIK